ncbi:c-type cytochrome [Marinobacter persicus]|uniref:Cytochrome c553 n=1 Tax=Marinobacter persicus TaxID=930118 RepID=A0A2S6G4Q1_9GAMM|nr:c-type cytochrome [Marinobacter persicus]PPK50684.1 cytochrome c553 [Marinobacter persicus]PPK54082.1 cytochrome c553 [Marinobacter persicus]PPK57269.1 cytochrome c553 [Marinobacter persicus]
MKRLIAGVVLGVSLTAVAHGAGDPAAGEQKAAVCTSCHGQGGAKPIMGSYPKLSGLGEQYLFNQLTAIKSGDRAVPQMTGLLDAMSDQDLRNLAAYFDSQEMVVNQANPDLVDQGRALFRGGNMASGVPACSGCHNPRGQGNEPGGYPALGGQNAEYIANQLKAYRNGERNGTSNSQIMMDVAAELTDAEIESVASYVSGLN